MGPAPHIQTEREMNVPHGPLQAQSQAPREWETHPPFRWLLLSLLVGCGNSLRVSQDACCFLCLCDVTQNSNVARPSYVLRSQSPQVVHRLEGLFEHTPLLHRPTRISSLGYFPYEAGKCAFSPSQRSASIGTWSPHLQEVTFFKIHR